MINVLLNPWAKLRGQLKQWQNAALYWCAEARRHHREILKLHGELDRLRRENDKLKHATRSLTAELESAQNEARCWQTLFQYSGQPGMAERRLH